MFKRIDHVELIPTDFRRTLDFYTEILGFTVRERFTIDVGPMQEIAYLTLCDTTVELMRVEQVAPPPAAQWIGGYHALALEVENMDEAVAYLEEKGVPITWGPMDLGRSIRAELHDPDELSIELRQWK